MTNLLIELQRQFVEYLDQTNNDITSAKIDFDHLLAGLVSCRGDCIFLDLDRIVSPGATIDGVHLKPKTYQKWAEELKPAITARCGSS